MTSPDTQGSVAGYAVPREEPPPLPKRKPFPTRLETVLIAVAFVLLQLVLAFLIAVPMAVLSMLRNPDVAPQVNVPVLLSANVLAALPLIAWGWWRSGLPFRQAFALEQARLDLLPYVVALAVGSNICFSEIDNLTRKFLPLPMWFSEVFTGLYDMPLAAVFILGIVAPLSEEPVFRGMLLRGRVRQGERWSAIFLTAILFGVVHISPAQAFYATLIGLVVGWLFVRSGALVPCMVFHGLHNLGVAFVNMLPIPPIPGFNTEPEPIQFQPLWFDAIGLAALLIGLAGIAWATAGNAVDSARNTE